MRMFHALMPRASVMEGRDTTFLRRFREDDALSAIDVLYGMIEYERSGGAQDVPSFIRWYRRQDGFDDVPVLERELSVAESISGQRLPSEGLPYFDMAYAEVSAEERPIYEAAQEVVRSFVDSIVGTSA